MRGHVHGANDSFVGAQGAGQAKGNGGGGSVCEAKPVPLRVPLLVPSTDKCSG
jgi:hypothetical protein